MLLYKYKNLADLQSFNYTLDSLKNKYFYFSRPSELNDPFDCQIQIDFSSSEADFEFWKNKNLERIPQNNRLLTFEGKNQLVNESKTQNGLERIRQFLVEKNHLLSLTSNCLNESMWALYAGNYNGICIGYNTDVNFNSFMPKKVEFKSEYGSIISPIDNKFIQFIPIKYDNEGNHPLKIFSSNPSEQFECVSYNLTHKKKCWSSENEYRAIIHDTDFNIQSLENRTVKVYYDDNILGEVIFGYHVPATLRDTIINMIKENYNCDVKFFLVEVDLESYSLIKKEI